MRTIKPALTAVAAAMLLAACGGGNDAGVPPETPLGNTIPASALASPAAYTAFVASLQASETALPLDVTGAVPPTTETDLPQAI